MRSYYKAGVAVQRYQRDISGFFADLCHTIVCEGADVALGCRMTNESRTPRIPLALQAARGDEEATRSVGSDTFRAYRRRGILSARALLSYPLRIPKACNERTREPKLGAGDGLRFPGVIPGVGLHVSR
jgi:hypothetical protein